MKEHISDLGKTAVFSLLLSGCLYGCITRSECDTKLFYGVKVWLPPNLNNDIQEKKISKFFENLLFYDVAIRRNTKVGCIEAEIVSQYGKDAKISVCMAKDLGPLPPRNAMAEKYGKTPIKEMYYRYPNGGEEYFWLRQDGDEWKVVANLSNPLGYLF